jgi:hypothetical protein
MADPLTEEAETLMAELLERAAEILERGDQGMSDFTTTLNDRLRSLIVRENVSPYVLYGLLDAIYLEHAIVPRHPTYEMVMEGLHPAIPGSVSEIYREMIKAAPTVAV